MEYRVLWEINIDADNHEDAAQEALRIQRDPESTATIFTVQEISEIVTIDLEREED